MTTATCSTTTTILSLEAEFCTLLVKKSPCAFGLEFIMIYFSVAKCLELFFKQFIIQKLQFSSITATVFIMTQVITVINFYNEKKQRSIK